MFGFCHTFGLSNSEVLKDLRLLGLKGQTRLWTYRRCIWVPLLYLTYLSQELRDSRSCTARHGLTVGKHVTASLSQSARPTSCGASFAKVHNCGSIGAGPASMRRDVPRHRHRGLEGLERVYRDLPKVKGKSSQQYSEEDISMRYHALISFNAVSMVSTFLPACRKLNYCACLSRVGGLWG